ncbi:hypothetical protein H6G06_26570 [Anabaena sphaerica FACHB-251]|uniref:Uncharacterized protein n=1 Tax=Anabaena sphaerica FACHB-251 TaxID=2692883 RepID=A0A926WMM9_9NOST|nr:hypothetical protein [Anabaena sphaerica]MBD2296942.1 hypothetical protein [Anabaena sphaerica FACHB-251]
MYPKISFVLVLSGIVIGLSSPVQAAIKIKTPQLVAQTESLSNANLSLEEMPSGFIEFPTERLEPLMRQYIAKRNMNVKSLAIFAKPQKAQVVIGVTMTLSEQLQQNGIDLNQVYFRDIVAKLIKQTQLFNKLEILESRALTDLNNVGEDSGGLTMVGRMMGRAVQIDVAMFRRNKVFAFTGVAYPNGDVPSVAVGELARKLDSKILQYSR